MTKQELLEENARLRALLDISDRVSEPVCNHSAVVAQQFIVKLAGLKQEQFHAVILDNKHRIIKDQLITMGTLNQSLVHPREVFAPAVESRAAAIILLHNHPSGDPSPSKQDIDITKRLQQAGDILGITVIDHIVIGGTSYFSFADEEIL